MCSASMQFRLVNAVVEYGTLAAGQVLCVIVEWSVAYDTVSVPEYR
jgi:hypothetical protein